VRNISINTVHKGDDNDDDDDRKEDPPIWVVRTHQLGSVTDRQTDRQTPQDKSTERNNKKRTT